MKLNVKERSAGQQLLSFRVQEGEEREREMRAERKEEREKRGISKMGLGGIEKSRGNSSTFTLIPRCVVGKM